MSLFLIVKSVYKMDTIPFLSSFFYDLVLFSFILSFYYPDGSVNNYFFIFYNLMSLKNFIDFINFINLNIYYIIFSLFTICLFMVLVCYVMPNFISICMWVSKTFNKYSNHDSDSKLHLKMISHLINGIVNQMKFYTNFSLMSKYAAIFLIVILIGGSVYPSLSKFTSANKVMTVLASFISMSLLQSFIFMSYKKSIMNSDGSFTEFKFITEVLPMVFFYLLISISLSMGVIMLPPGLFILEKLGIGLTILAFIPISKFTGVKNILVNSSRMKSGELGENLESTYDFIVSTSLEVVDTISKPAGKVLSECFKLLEHGSTQFKFYFAKELKIIYDTKEFMVAEIIKSKFYSGLMDTAKYPMMDNKFIFMDFGMVIILVFLVLLVMFFSKPLLNFCIKLQKILKKGFELNLVENFNSYIVQSGSSLMKCLEYIGTKEEDLNFKDLELKLSSSLMLIVSNSLFIIFSAAIMIVMIFK